jgi:hypothetical protein
LQSNYTRTTMNKSISSVTRYIGVDDLDLDLFEGQYKIANGVS